MKKLIILSVTACITLLLVQCSPKSSKTVSATPATPEEKVAAIKKEYTDAQLAEGKTIFEGNCAKCHQLKLPQNFDVPAWERIIPDMARKSHLDAQQTGLVRAYILSNAKMS
jgi:mono/diheme cytochrome c family protein